MPILSISFLNACLFSVISIASISTPIISTLCSSQIPISLHLIHRFNAVCPPIVGRTASTECFCNISSIDSTSRGSK